MFVISLQCPFQIFSKNKIGKDDTCGSEHKVDGCCKYFNFGYTYLFIFSKSLKIIFFSKILAFAAEVIWF